MRKVNELDNRGSQFYLAMYWAQALKAQETDAELSDRFESVGAALSDNEELILSEIEKTQGPEQDLGGYYMLDAGLAATAMRPSKTFNRIIDGI